LSVQDDSLQFQQNGKPAAKVKIALVRNVLLGAESKQVGGLPMTLGKTAVPFGGGRVVSLFAHKKYDTLTLEYADADEGIHGAIFQLTKGQGELVKNNNCREVHAWQRNAACGDHRERRHEVNSTESTSHTRGKGRSAEHGEWRRSLLRQQLAGYSQPCPQHRENDQAIILVRFRATNRDAHRANSESSGKCTQAFGWQGTLHQGWTE
jgi:hypothetical protein